jgi:hypothetical protein
MDIFTFIFLVVLVGCSIPLLKIWLEGRQQGRVSDDEVQSLRREIGGLKERVQVLEKIVTDKSYDVRRQFAELGDD